MKKKQTIHIQQDQTFLEGINLITGLKINYDRPVLTQNELTSLCIDEKLSRKQKAIKILKSGQMLQKWSLFDNLVNYLNQPQQYQQILLLIEKFYEDLQPMLDIVAIGLLGCVNKMISTFQVQNEQNQSKNQLFTQKAEQSLFRLCMRSFTDEKYNFIALDQWSQLFGLFFVYLSITKSSQLNKFTEQCIQYISGSFSMTTSPERRRIAFQMIKGLIEHSQKVMQRAKTKAVFFNNDTNSKTRIVICEAMGKLLLLRPDDEEIRNFLLDYFNDMDQAVIEKSFNILSQIPHQKHLQAIMNTIEEEQDYDLISSLVLENLQNFVQKFHHLIRQSKRYKLILINLINSVLKSGEGLRILKIFPLLIKIYNLIYTTKKQRQQDNLFDVFVIQDMDFEEEDSFKSLIKLYKISQQDDINLPITKSFEFYLHKNIKSQRIKSQFSKNLENLKIFLSIFTYETQEQNNTYTMFLTKTIQDSKWSLVEFLLQELKKVPLNEQNFDRISMSLFRLILHCPYYLLEIVCQSILFLLLSKRKHLEFFLSIKDKLNCSKTWMQRRNYIILYAQIKAGSSYDFHKTIPILNYKLIAKQKCVGVKLEFLKYALKIYQSIDPESKLQKLALKECVNQICNDKDQDVTGSAKQIQKKLIQSQIDFVQLQKISHRNSIFMVEQEKMRQKDALMLKKTKTQRQLGRKDSKCKTITVESRTSLRLHKDLSKDFVKKQITIVNIDRLKRPITVTNKDRSFQQKSQKYDRAQDDKKGSSTATSNIPVMPRIMSGQMKTATKTLALRRESGFKK